MPAGTVYSSEKDGDGRLTPVPPPIVVRLHDTAGFVEAGFDPSVTVACRVVEFPAARLDGDATPVAVGGVEELETVSAMLKVPVRGVGDAVSVTMQGNE